MPKLKNYDGQDIKIPDHKHSVSDTKRNGETAIASSINDGFMSKEDKIELDNLKTRADQMVEKLKSGVYKTFNKATLIPGSSFYNAIPSTAATLIFTDTPIPANKISTARLVSTTDSETKAYLYSDGTTAYVSPEKENTIIYANANCYAMFLVTKLTTIDFLNFDTSNVTDMHNMFTNSSIVNLLNLQNFNTSKVTTMSNMFDSCTKLKSLNLISFDTSNVTDMGSMFSACSSLESIEFSYNFNTSKVTNMRYMFNSLTLLSSLDLSSFDTSKVTNMEYMFYNSPKLISSINITNPLLTNAQSMFGGACTDSSSKFIVNYSKDCLALATDMVKTKSTNSNVFLGYLIQ